MKSSIKTLVLLSLVGLIAGVGFGWWSNSKQSDVKSVSISSDLDLVIDAKASPQWRGLSSCHWIDAISVIQNPNMATIEKDLINGLRNQSVPVFGRVTMGYALQFISSSRQAASPGTGVDSSWCLGRGVLYNALLESDYTSAVDYLRTTIGLMNSGKSEHWKDTVKKLQDAEWDIGEEEIALLNESASL